MELSSNHKDHQEKKENQDLLGLENRPQEKDIISESGIAYFSQLKNEYKGLKMIESHNNQFSTSIREQKKKNISILKKLENSHKNLIMKVANENLPLDEEYESYEYTYNFSKGESQRTRVTRTRDTKIKIKIDSTMSGIIKQSKIIEYNARTQNSIDEKIKNTKSCDIQYNERMKEIDEEMLHLSAKNSEEILENNTFMTNTSKTHKLNYTPYDKTPNTKEKSASEEWKEDCTRFIIAGLDKIKTQNEQINSKLSSFINQYSETKYSISYDFGNYMKIGESLTSISTISKELRKKNPLNEKLQNFDNRINSLVGQMDKANTDDTRDRLKGQVIIISDLLFFLLLDDFNSIPYPDLLFKSN